MKTEILEIDNHHIDIHKIRFAADVIKSGGLVAFPTETVYGLGANALNERSVQKIFEAKGRPSDNPLIVHISEAGQVGKLTACVSETAKALMKRFWPGPLTLVLEKSGIIPDAITAGLDTVALRMPIHPVALALINECGLPVAAPSANTSGKPSPTSAEHVIEDLYGKIDVIINAGRTDVGLESTVVDVTVNPPLILRPGGITPEQLQQALGVIEIDPALASSGDMECKPRSPGMKYTHYSPKASVVVVEGDLQEVVRKVNELIQEGNNKGMRVGVLATEQTRNFYNHAEIISAGDRERPETIAANLFWALREFDLMGVQLILAESIEYNGIGLAVMNRMNKAAGFNIIKV